jgi:hypothetical protein
MLIGLLAATTLAASPTPPPTPEQIDASRFELHIGLRGGARMLGGAAFGGGAMFGLGVRIWQGLYFEASLGEGVFTQPRASGTTTAFRHRGPHGEPIASTTVAPRPDAPDLLLAGQIVFGLRYEVRTPATKRVRPSVFVGLTHAHEATFADFLDAPGKALLGTGTFIDHRTGALVGVGVRLPFPSAWGRVAPRFGLRVDADAAYYVDDDPGRLQASVGVGVQAVF